MILVNKFIFTERNKWYLLGAVLALCYYHSTRHPAHQHTGQTNILQPKHHQISDPGHIQPQNNIPLAIFMLIIAEHPNEVP